MFIENILAIIVMILLIISLVFIIISACHNHNISKWYITSGITFILAVTICGITSFNTKCVKYYENDYDLPALATYTNAEIRYVDSNKEDRIEHKICFDQERWIYYTRKDPTYSQFRKSK